MKDSAIFRIVFPTRVIVLATIIVLLVAGCAPIAPADAAAQPAIASGATVEGGNLREGCVENYDPSIDYFPDKSVVTQGDVWNIEYHNNYKVISVTNPWRGAEETFAYVLVQCGTPAPEGFPEAQIIEVPVERVITMSSTQIPILVALGRVEALVGMDSFDYVTALEVLERIAAGDVTAVGYQSGMDLEQVIALEPDLVLTYGYGDPQYDVHPKLLEAGVPVGLHSDYMESSPLGRSEWIKFIAAFFNDEATANQVFDATVNRYEELATLAHGVEEQPTVLLGAARGDNWSMPGGGGYVARFLADAGAAYLWADDTSTGNIPLTYEEVLDKAQDADYWLNTGSWKSLADGLNADERNAEFDAFAPGRIFNNNLRLNDRGGNDYWERGIANPDEVLADLIHIFHPELLPEHELIFYRALE